MTNLNNPLRRHFRQPAISLTLPSRGRFYPDNTLDMPPNGELPVLPMTAVDEITSRTPDSLFNGSAVVEIISSCIPNIKNAWEVPSVDLNPILVAIRIASYGHKIEIDSRCPNCGHEHEFEIDLRHVLDSFGTPDYDTPLQIGDLQIRFAPLTYKEVNDNNKRQFEDQKLIQVLNSAEVNDDERLKLLGDSFRKITDVTVNALAHSIRSITSPDGIVAERAFIEEFLRNCEKSIFNRIKDHAINLRQETEIKPMDVTCTECSTAYKQEFSLDMTNFFDTNS